jgi:HAMP domain-containing protein
LEQKNKQVWEDYKKAASKPTVPLKKLKKAQDDLATSLVNEGNYLSNITDDNYDYYVGLLKELGIVNAAEIATQALNQKKIDEKTATFDATTATSAEITEVGNYITSLGDASDSLAYYTIKKQIANNNALDTSESIANLITLAKQCGITGKAISALSALEADQSRLENIRSEVQEGKYHDTTEIDYVLNKIEKDRKKVDSVINEKAKVTVKTTDGNKTNGSSDSSNNGSGSSSKDSSSKTEIDWIERKLTRLQGVIDRTSAKFETEILF